MDFSSKIFVVSLFCFLSILFEWQIFLPKLLYFEIKFFDWCLFFKLFCELIELGGTGGNLSDIGSSN